MRIRIGELVLGPWFGETKDQGAGGPRGRLRRTRHTSTCEQCRRVVMATNAAHETQLYCRVFFKARFFSIQLFFAEFLCPTYASGVTFFIFFFNSSPPSIGGVRKKNKKPL